MIKKNKKIGLKKCERFFLMGIFFKVGCEADAGCFADPEKRFCSDNQCVGGCRETVDCDGFDGICNVPGYDDCNYCVFEEMAEIGVCTPGTSWCQYPPILIKICIIVTPMEGSKKNLLLGDLGDMSPISGGGDRPPSR